MRHELDILFTKHFHLTITIIMVLFTIVFALVLTFNSHLCNGLIIGYTVAFILIADPLIGLGVYEIGNKLHKE